MSQEQNFIADVIKYCPGTEFHYKIVSTSIKKCPFKSFPVFLMCRTCLHSKIVPKFSFNYFRISCVVVAIKIAWYICKKNRPNMALRKYKVHIHKYWIISISIFSWFLQRHSFVIMYYTSLVSDMQFSECTFQWPLYQHLK